MAIKRRAAIGAAAVILVGGATAGPAAAGGAQLCVGGKGCYRSVQEAVDAAKPGSTIRINAGTFAGGVHIAKSLRLVGSGAGRTVLRGGDSVLFVDSAHGRPIVGVSGLTITGGVANETLGNDWIAHGGGILIPPTPPVSPGGPPTLGADVTLEGVEVVGNRATPTGTYPSPAGAVCPDGPCPYAGSYGGGIANFGSLLIRNSVIGDNAADGHVSDADGGGIYSAIGDLRIESSKIIDNRALPAPNEIGRFAEGGGVFVDSGSLTIRDSTVSGNDAHLFTLWPAKPQGELLDMNANSGGVHIGDGITALVQDSRITGNSVVAEDPYGEPLAIDAAMIVGESSLVMRRTAITDNTLSQKTLTTDDVGPCGSAVELDGSAQITDTRIEDNPVSITTLQGTATANGGLAVLDFAGTADRVTLTRVSISRNSASARSEDGLAEVLGAGVFNNASVEMSQVTVAGNVGTARGTEARAQGGGIWNGPMLSGDVPVPVVLTVSDSKIAHNTLTTTPAGTASGGGIYTTTPITVQRTTITGNRPDDCSGCTGTAARTAPGPSSQRLAPELRGHSMESRSRSGAPWAMRVNGH